MKRIILSLIAFVVLMSIIIVLNKIYVWELPIIGIGVGAGIAFFYTAMKANKKDDAK